MTTQAITYGYIKQGLGDQMDKTAAHTMLVVLMLIVGFALLRLHNTNIHMNGERYEFAGFAQQYVDGQEVLIPIYRRAIK